MRHPLDVPAATADREDLADWLELLALSVADRNSSIQDLVRELRRSGTSEAIGDPTSASYKADDDGEVSMRVAEDAFGEIEDRFRACGGHPEGDPGFYPFRVEDGYIELRDDNLSSAYVFMLLLSNSKSSREGKVIGAKPTSLFENVCALAARSYFGGNSTGVGALAFGFPRRIRPKGFADALDNLCMDLGEGKGHRADRPGLKDQKDGRLDVVAWRDFSDRREGKLIGFGQCATSRKDKKKATELHPHNFCSMWMRDIPVVMPVRMLFVPWRHHMQGWRLLASDGGILFDRCRIAQHSGPLEGQLARECGRWVRDTIKRLPR
jgi:hypothetical protein